MNILITNDDGYKAQGLQALVRALRPMGNITVVAPKYHQSAMSTAVTMGLKPIAVKKVSESDKETWWYLDGTPASCVKFAIDEIFIGKKIDLLVSGINHGANTASAALYSATVGAAEEGALAGIPSIAVSMDDLNSNADFSAAEALLPGIVRKLVKKWPGKFGLLYNINFPKGKAEDIRGIRVCHQGVNHWEKEFRHYDSTVFNSHGYSAEDMGLKSTAPVLEDGEDVYVMVGDIVDNDCNVEPADHHYLKCGYITIVAAKIDFTDYAENGRLRDLGFDTNF